MNQIMPFLLEELVKRYPDKEIYVTSGFETAQLRNRLGLPKTHVIDAWCIAASRIDIDHMDPSIVTNVAKLQPYEIKQFRRQNRAIINNQRERTYKLNGKAVAKNRHKRFEQETDALEDWYNKQTALHGKKKADKMLSQLTVTRSTRYYNTPGRVMPGAVFLYNNKRQVLLSQQGRGKYYNSHNDDCKSVPAAKCKILLHNTGLVYL
jgi:hypothetical protein